MPDSRGIAQSADTSNAVSDREPPLRLVSWRLFGNIKRAIFCSEKVHRLWYAETEMPPYLEQAVNPWRWDTQPRKINMQYVRPRYDASWMTLAARMGPVYEKQLDLLRQGNDLFTTPWLKSVTLREIRTCEALRKHPHPNVCLYRGITVDEAGLVCGLVFDRYDVNLYDMMWAGRLFDATRCPAHVQAGIAHVHSLGFVHCDVKPENIFVRVQSQHFVIGDFDSAHDEGDALSIKSGTVGWAPEDADTQNIATRDIDVYSMELVRAWLAKKGGGD